VRAIRGFHFRETDRRANESQIDDVIGTRKAERTRTAEMRANHVEAR
jgi:hypothetical protein